MRLDVSLVSRDEGEVREVGWGKGGRREEGEGKEKEEEEEAIR